MSQLTVGADRVVTIQYTLTVEGEQLDSGRLDYLHGHHNIVPGLEAGLDGQAPGAKLDVEVPPGLGYGERDEDPPQRVPRRAFPAEMHIAAGMQFHARSPDGDVMPVWVAGVEGDTVLVDTNHPLAGKTLNFDVAVIDVRAATAEELQHGHVHGPDGHGHGH